MVKLFSYLRCQKPVKQTNKAQSAKFPTPNHSETFMDTRKRAAKLAQKINLPEKGSAKAKGKRGYEHLWETVLKGTDKRDQKKKKKKRKELRERGLGLGLCQSGGIWPDDGFTAFKCVRYTLINSSRLHQSHTCNSQHANYGEEADSDSYWKLPNFQRRGGGEGISALRQAQRSPDPCWEKGRGRHGCGEGVLAGLFPRRAGRGVPCQENAGHGERCGYPAGGCLSRAGFAPASPQSCRQGSCFPQC